MPAPLLAAAADHAGSLSGLECACHAWIRWWSVCLLATHLHIKLRNVLLNSSIKRLLQNRRQHAVPGGGKGQRQGVAARQRQAGAAPAAIRGLPNTHGVTVEFVLQTRANQPADVTAPRGLWPHLSDPFRPRKILQLTGREARHSGRLGGVVALKSGDRLSA